MFSGADALSLEKGMAEKCLNPHMQVADTASELLSLAISPRILKSTAVCPEAAWRHTSSKYRSPRKQVTSVTLVRQSKLLDSVDF